MPAVSRRAAFAAALAAAVAGVGGCTPSPDPGPPRLGTAPIRLGVSRVDVADQIQNLPVNFIDRRRSDEMAAATRDYLRQHLMAAGGSDTAKALVEQASLVEQREAPAGLTGAITGGKLQ